MNGSSYWPRVFPTPVGVFPPPSLLLSIKPSLPHARGGVSTDHGVDDLVGLSSPRPWGCFHHGQGRRRWPQVFPTPVGVFLTVAMRPPTLPRLPHARGGVSKGSFYTMLAQESSPRPWGCFPPLPGVTAATTVFPTPVGVFRFGSHGFISFSSLPHARGGVSWVMSCCPWLVRSSPRPWGCFRHKV